MKISTAASIGVAAFTGAYVFAVRPRFLHWGSTAGERQASWPGDSLAKGARATSMRAITIDAPPERVWPWIVQIGQDRAGFYSYRELENAAGARMPKVEELVPEFQHRFVGDTVWLSDPRTYRGKGKMIVAYLEENRAMILVSPEDWQRVLGGKPIAGTTWGFILEPAPDDKTRLVMRSISKAGPFARERLLSYAWEIPHCIMEWRMMQHLKTLVERSITPRITVETVEIEVEPA